MIGVQVANVCSHFEPTDTARTALGTLVGMRGLDRTGVLCVFAVRCALSSKSLSVLTIIDERIGYAGPSMEKAVRRGVSVGRLLMNRNSYDELRVELYELMDRLKKERYIPAETLCGLTFCEMQVLRWVYMANQRNEDAKPSDMARHFRITPSAVSQSIKKLESRGYVARTRSDADSRVVRLALTDDGLDVAERIQEKHIAFMNDLFEYVGVDNIEQLTKTLRLMLEFLEQNPSLKRCDRKEGDSCA